MLRLSSFSSSSAAAVAGTLFRISPPYRRRTRMSRAVFAASASASEMATSAVELEGGKNKQPWLFVGLGNPGRLYESTRHNVGFEMIDVIAEAEGISMNKMEKKALFGKGQIGDATIMLAKPQTFMNISGESVGPLISYYKIPLNQVLVIYDDLDLPFGKLRLLPKGGHGGHNGMRSIIKHLKENRDFPRLRIGIGRPPGKMNPASFVMRRFDKREQEELDFALMRGLEAVRILVRDGMNKSASFVNTKTELLNK